MPPFTSWFRGADEHRLADRHRVPGRLPRHADARRPRPTGSRRTASTCARRGRLRAVPAPGARARRRPGPPRHRVLRPARCSRRSACPTGCPPTTPGPADRALGDHDARRRRRAARPGAGLHPRRARRRRDDHARPAHAVRGLDPRRACSRTWRTRSTRSPRRPAGGSRSPARRRPPGRVAALQDKACALLGAWSARRPRTPSPSATSPWPAPLLVATAALEITVHGWDVGRATGARHPDPRRAGPRRCSRSPAAVVDAGDRGVRFAARAARAADAAYDARLLAFLGRDLTGPPPADSRAFRPPGPALGFLRSAPCSPTR